MFRNQRFAFWLTALVLFIACPLLLAQDGTQTGPSTGHHKVKGGPLINVTGCLKRGSEPRGYYISDSDGRTWELTSKKVDLSQHINHVVSVAGHALPQSKEQEAQNGASEKSEAAGNQVYDMQVTQFELLSTSCTR